jgi:hypothetical protein
MKISILPFHYSCVPPVSWGWISKCWGEISKVLDPKTESSKLLFVNDGTLGCPLYMTILGESLFKTNWVFCLCVLVTEARLRELVGGHRQQKAMTSVLVRLSSRQRASRQASAHGSGSDILLFSPLILIYIRAICSKQRCCFFFIPTLESAIAHWIPNYAL